MTDRVSQAAADDRYNAVSLQWVKYYTSSSAGEMSGLVDAVKVTPNTSSIGPAPSSNCSTCCRPDANSGSTAQRSLSVSCMMMLTQMIELMMIIIILRM